MFDSQIFGHQSETLFGNTIQSAVAPPRNPNCSVPPTARPARRALLGCSRVGLPLLADAWGDGIALSTQNIRFQTKTPHCAANGYFDARAGDASQTNLFLARCPFKKM
jgi:hypothetical protein